MDPICHTLAGASLAQAGLKRWSPFAATTLVIGANLPDVDIIANAWGGDASLYFRRGWTHGVLALVVLPLALTGSMLLIDRVRRWRRMTTIPARAAPLLALSFLSVWSHPALDWLNTYGVRLLMPFSGRWFYGDAVFIIDPWLWLLLAAAVVVATTHRALGVVGWLVLGLVTSAFMFGVDEVPAPARVAWVFGIAAIAAARVVGAGRESALRVAHVCLIAAAAYVALMILGSRVAVAQASRWLDEQGRVRRHVMAGPLPVNPFIREVIVTGNDHYSFHVVHLLTGDVRPASPDVPINGPTPVTDAALASPRVRGLKAWMRFPSYEVQRLDDGYRVTVRDVRYSRFGARSRGLGEATVELDGRLQPR